MARKEKHQKEKNHKTRDYIVFFICAFVLIFLTSSFVVENVYNAADKITVSPEGVKEIYLAATGRVDFGENYNKDSKTKDDNNTKNQSTSTEQQSTGDK